MHCKKNIRCHWVDIRLLYNFLYESKLNYDKNVLLCKNHHYIYKYKLINVDVLINSNVSDFLENIKNKIINRYYYIILRLFKKHNTNEWSKLKKWARTVKKNNYTYGIKSLCSY